MGKFGQILTELCPLIDVKNFSVSEAALYLKHFNRFSSIFA